MLGGHERWAWRQATRQAMACERACCFLTGAGTGAWTRLRGGALGSCGTSASASASAGAYAFGSLGAAALSALAGRRRVRVAARCSRSLLCASGRRAGGGAAFAQLPREEMVKTGKVKGLEKELVTRVVELAERAMTDWSVQATAFLDPIDASQILELLTPFEHAVRAVAWGGHPAAERTLVAFLQPDSAASLIPASAPMAPPTDFEAMSLLDASAIDAMRGVFSEHLTLIAIKGNFLFDPANHRDFLGALMSCGIERNMVGDIVILGDRGAQAVLHRNVAQAVCDSLREVRTVPVECSIVEDWSQLQMRVPQKKEVRSVEASMRLDAVGSAAFGMSRSKMADRIRAGDVKVNWREAKSGSAVLKAGDVISVRGKGRAQIESVEVTAKERFRVAMARFT